MALTPILRHQVILSLLRYLINFLPVPADTELLSNRQSIKGFYLRTLISNETIDMDSW